MPVPLSDESHKFGNFDLVKRVKLDFSDITVSKWRSRITGLTVVHLDYEGTTSSNNYISMSTHCTGSPNRERILCRWHRKLAVSL